MNRNLLETRLGGYSGGWMSWWVEIYIFVPKIAKVDVIFSSLETVKFKGLMWDLRNTAHLSENNLIVQEEPLSCSERLGR